MPVLPKLPRKEVEATEETQQLRTVWHGGGHYKATTSLTSKPHNLGGHVGTLDSLVFFFC